MTGDVNFQGVDVRFGAVPALRALDLRVADGEAVALLGPSGAGKTTLLRLINGSVVPSAGTVRVGGQDLASLDYGALRRLRSRVAVIHQDLRLVPNVSVARNVLSGGLGRQGFWSSTRTLLRPRDAELEAAHALLERVGVADKLFHRTDRLSGGQQQRVAVARALYQQPRVMLADEPVASVDPARARDLVTLLARLAREDGATLIMSLHSPELAREFFPRAVALRDGRVAADGPPSALDLDALYRLPAEADAGGGA